MNRISLGLDVPATTLYSTLFRIQLLSSPLLADLRVPNVGTPSTAECLLVDTGFEMDPLRQVGLGPDLWALVS